MNNQHYRIGGRDFISLHPLAEELTFEAGTNYFFELGNLAIISVIGDKAAEFLQGQLSCDLRLVTPNQIRPGLMCNLKGRVLAMLDVIDWQGLKLLLPNDLMQETRENLSKTALLSRVNLQPDSTLKVYGLKVSNPETMPPEFKLPSEPYGLTYSSTHCCYSLGHDLFICLVEEPKYADHKQAYIENKTVRASLAWHYLQLRSKHTSIYPETRGLFLPHRLDLQKTAYISFDKGCYKGQEIIARTHYRAKLKHHLQLFSVETEASLILGSKLFHVETQQEIGELIDFCPCGNNSYLIACSIVFDNPSVIKMEQQEQILRLKDLVVLDNP